LLSEALRAASINAEFPMLWKLRMIIREHEVLVSSGEYAQYKYVYPLDKAGQEA
jgi:hypothetical protein